ncbi:hypothetical protein HDU81_001277 [Chytriomyces hyalinus]|nr:hypothetical protein HDU81_001277 [Chytriomyces hyalinus]
MQTRASDTAQAGRSGIIRYTVAQLRALAKSPLVQRPESLPEIDSYRPQPTTQGRTANAEKDNSTREGRDRRQNRDNFPRPPKVSVDGSPLPDAADESAHKDRKVFDSTGARMSQTGSKNQLPRVPRSNNQRDRENNNRDRDRDRSDKDPAWMTDPTSDTSDSKQRRSTNNRRSRNEKSPEKSALPSPSTHQQPANNELPKQAMSISLPLSSTPPEVPPSSTAKQQVPERTQFEFGVALKSSNSSAATVDPRYKGLDAIQIFRLQMKQRERQERGEPDSPPPAPQQPSTTVTPVPGPFSFPEKSLNEVERMFFADLGATPPSIPSVVSIAANSANSPPVGPLSTTRGAMLGGLRGVAESPFLKQFIDDERSASSKASPLKSRFVDMFEPEQGNQQQRNQGLHQTLDQLHQRRDGPISGTPHPGVNLIGLLGKMNSEGIGKKGQPGFELPLSASIHSEEEIIRQLKQQHRERAHEQQNQHQYVNIQQQQRSEGQMRNQHQVDVMTPHQQQLEQNQRHKQQRLAALSAGLCAADSQRMSAMILQQLAGGGAADTTKRQNGLPEASEGRVDLQVQQFKQPTEFGSSQQQNQPGQQTQLGSNVPKGPSKKLMSEEDVLKIMGISGRGDGGTGENNRTAELPSKDGMDANTQKSVENGDAGDTAPVMDMLARSNMLESTQQQLTPIHLENHDPTSLSRQMQPQPNQGRGVPAFRIQGGDGGAKGGLPPQFVSQLQQQNAVTQRNGPMLPSRVESPTNMAPLLQQQEQRQNQNPNQQPQHPQYIQQIQQQMQLQQPHSGIPPYLMQHHQQQHHSHLLQQQQQLLQQRGGPLANGLQGPGSFMQQPHHFSTSGGPGFMNRMSPPMGQRFGPPQLPMNGQPPPPGMPGIPPGMLAGQGPPPGMIGLPPPGMFGGGGMGAPQGMLGMPHPPGMMEHAQPPPPGLGGMPPGMMVGPPPGLFGGVRGGGSPIGGDDTLAMMIQNSVAGRKAVTDGNGIMGQMQQQQQQHPHQQHPQQQHQPRGGFLN